MDDRAALKQQLTRRVCDADRHVEPDAGAKRPQLVLVRAPLDADPVAILKELDRGGNAIGAIDGPARARVYPPTEERYTLMVPVNRVHRLLLVTWLRALARDVVAHHLPDLSFHLVTAVSVPQRLWRMQEQAADMVSVWQGLEHTPRLAEHDKTRRVEWWEQRLGSLRDEACSYLELAMMQAPAQTPLPAGAPLSSLLDPFDEFRLFEMLGREAAADDVRRLGYGGLEALGVAEDQARQLLS